MTSVESKEDDLQRKSNNVDRMQASKVLGKKPFASASRLAMSTQVWLNTIPTRNCDVLMTFPPKTDDAVLMWLLSRLRSRIPELVVHVRHHSNTNVYGFYFTASYENILKGADELALVKPVKEKFGGGKKEFAFEDRDCYEGVEDHLNFLNSQERQCIVKNILFSLRAREDDQLGKIKFGEGQGIVPILLSKKMIDQVLPLHNNDDMEFLRKTWVKAVAKSQPLDKICDYFGVKIAMYFAYLGHYTRFVSLPTIVGLIFWCLEKKNQFYDDIFFVAFAFLNVVWATLYLEHWKRQSAELAYKWGTLDTEDELLTEPRPLFHGRLQKSTVTGRQEPYYAPWKRNLFRYCVSMPVIAICLCTVFAVMWCLFELQDYINSKGMKGPPGFLLKLLPKIMLAVSIGVLDDMYKKIAYWLNDKENYRLDEQYENHLIIKIVLFQFVNSFLSLFYIAFYLQDMNRLKDQLAALLITRQIIGNVKEAVLPFVLSKIKLFKMGYKMTKDAEKKKKEEDEEKKKAEGGANEETSNGGVTEVANEASELRQRKFAGAEGGEQIEVKRSGPQLTQAEIEASQKEYEGTFEDYLEMLVQFGYVTLFSSAFPLAALCAFLNNIIEIRSDAFKLCFTFQRPFGQRVQNIGTWQDALEVMSVIAVMVNCALIGMSDLAERLFPGWGTTERLVLIVALEHIILIVKFLVAYAIPDIPQWVAEEKARLEYLRRDALKKVEGKGSNSNPTSPTGMFAKPNFSGEDSKSSFNPTRNYGRRGPPGSEIQSSSDMVQKPASYAETKID